MVAKAGYPNPKATEGLFRAVFINYSLILHATLSFAVLLLLVFFVDGRNANLKTGKRYKDGKTFWRVSDITTIVSSALVLVRLASSSWAGLAAWRCAFILLEKGGLSLEQFDRLVSWHVPLLPLSERSTHSLLATTVLVLLLPSLFSPPLLTGAVDWQSVPVPVDQTSIPNGNATGSPDMWRRYLSHPPVRAGYVTQAVAFSTLAAQGFYDEDKISCRHFLPGTSSTSVGSTAENAVLPCVKINSLSWDKKLEKSVQEYLVNETATVSITDANVYSDWFFPGRSIIFSPDKWNSPQLYPNGTKYPAPTRFKNTKKIAILVDWDLPDCSSIGETLFGNETIMSRYSILPVAVPPPPVDSLALGKRLPEGNFNCYLVGNVNITTGVVRNQISQFISRSVIEFKEAKDSQLEPDVWVAEAVFLMSDVMVEVAKSNMSQTPTWDNVEGYAKDLILQSYTGAWDSLTWNMGAQPAIGLTLHNNVDMLQASVNRTRLGLWFLSQLIFTVSGVILLVLQGTCHHPVVTHGVAASLVVNSTDVPWVGWGGREDPRVSEVDRQACLEKKLHLVEMAMLPDDNASSQPSRVAFCLVGHEGDFAEIPFAHSRTNYQQVLGTPEKTKLIS